MLEAENEGHRSMTPDWGTLEIALFLLVLYSSALGLVLGWCGWSVVKHGWRKGGLRRASYILFALFLATRVCWCIVLMAEAMGVAPLASDSEISTSVALGPTSRLLMAPVARLFDCLAYFLHFAVLSLLVCGWAESRYMMSETRSMQPVNMRPSGLLHHYRPTYFAINATFAGLMTVGLLPLVCAPQGEGWIGAGEKLDLFLTAGFSLMLAVASMVAGKPACPASADRRSAHGAHSHHAQILDTLHSLHNFAFYFSSPTRMPPPLGTTRAPYPCRPARSPRLRKSLGPRP
eukprot:scaffold4002_cov123-Isochrysis_galbana.AAC.7